MPSQDSKTRSPRNDPVEDFFDDSWAVYEHVLDHNYMFHEDIYRNVRGYLALRYADRPFSLLDLGCGSARHLADALQGLPVSRYRGYDLSAVALEHAQRNLSGLGRPVEVRQGDLLAALGMETDSYDLVFSSFAVHHLQPQEKAEFFRLAAARIADSGALLLIDVVREEEEDRNAYLDRYCAWMEADWTTLPPAALALVGAHIRESDFPETGSQLQRMAADAGLRPSVKLPDFLFHRTLVWDPAGV